MGQLLTKTVFLQKISHILCFPFVLKHFRDNSLKNSLFIKKNISERSSEMIRKSVLLNKFEKEQIQEKIRICC